MTDTITSFDPPFPPLHYWSVGEKGEMESFQVVSLEQEDLGNVNINSIPVEWAVIRKGVGLTCHARLDSSPSGVPIGQTFLTTFTEYSTLGLYMIMFISQFPTLVPAVKDYNQVEEPK